MGNFVRQEMRIISPDGEEHRALEHESLAPVRDTEAVAQSLQRVAREENGDICYAFIKECRGFITTVGRSSNLTVGPPGLRARRRTSCRNQELRVLGAIDRDISLPKA
jgi:hypothetical protein